MSGVPSAVHPLLTDRGNLRRRRRLNRLVEVVSIAAALLAVAVLLIVVGSVLARGIGSINLGFLTNSTALFGETGGGIANAIVGSAIIVGLAAAMAVPTGILIGIYTTEFSAGPVAHAVRFGLDVLNGVPTIVTGIFVFGLIVVPQGGQSGFAAAVALGIVMLPIVARTAQEVLALVPIALREAALALGITRWRTVVRITIPTAAPGILTGALLAVARAAGETAPLILASAIFAPGVLVDPSQGLASIPVFIFQSSESPSPEAHAQAWAAASILIAFVLALNVVARLFHARSRRRMGA